MTDKLSDKDKKDWENYLKNPGKIEDKDIDESEKFNFNIEKSIDLHGYTLDDANKKIYDTWVFSRDTRSTNPNWQLVDILT